MTALRGVVVLIVFFIGISLIGYMIQGYVSMNERVVVLDVATYDVGDLMGDNKDMVWVDPIDRYWILREPYAWYIERGTAAVGDTIHIK